MKRSKKKSRRTSRVTLSNDKPWTEAKVHKHVIARMDALMRSLSMEGIDPADAVLIAFTYTGMVIAEASEDKFREQLDRLQLVITLSKTDETLVRSILHLLPEDIRRFMVLGGRHSRNGVESQSTMPCPPVA